VAIPGFGSFVGVKHDEKIVRDLTSGNRLLLPPAIELEFVAGGRLKHEVGEDHQA
jgi:nucleoid DNA-binding protein